MTIHRIPRTVITVAAVALIGASTAVPAMAKDGDVIRRGDCTGSTDWKLKASPENGAIEVEGEIDSNKNGQTWTWRIEDNGVLRAKGTALTQAPSGSFSVRRVVANVAGTDVLVLRAANAATGETCKGTVSF